MGYFASNEKRVRELAIPERLGKRYRFPAPIGAEHACPLHNRALTFSVICRRQLWSTYAVHLTTMSPPALVGDVALIWLLWVGTSEWPVEHATIAIQALLIWVLFSKFIKLLTHFVRYPVDIFLWPVSILFGWFHGSIKVYAMLTLNEVRASSHTPPLYWIVLCSP